MVLCIIFMVIFGILGIFSAKYRGYFKESLHCVGRMMTLRPCDTAFDQEMKNKIVSKLSTKHEGLAKFIYKRFALLSWLFLIVFVVSMAWTAYSVFNLAYYGTCDPLNPTSCVFNLQQTQPNSNQVSITCPYENITPTSGTPGVGGFYNVDSYTISGKPTVYFFGTTWCPHCKWERPIFVNATSKFGSWYDITEDDLSNAKFTSQYFDVRATEIDKQSSVNIAVFNHYSPNGTIPLIVVGGKYYRAGSGEALGEEKDYNVLMAYLCNISDNPIEECKNTAISAMVAEIE